MSSALSSFSARSSIMSSFSGTSGSWGQSSTRSVHGGAGGYGTRVSRASASASRAYDVLTNDKETMKNLNDRLASYLEQVRTLECSNRKLESKILEYCEKRTRSDHKTDYSAYFTLIADLRNKIFNQQLENQNIIFRMNDVQLATNDFRLKADKEMALRGSVGADVSRLREARDSLTLTRSSLELQIQGLKEELIHTKKHHEEEMRLLHSQQGGSLNVEVDSAESVDLTEILSEVRQQYETVMKKNKTELQRWFQTKVVSINTEITATTGEAQSSHTELSELKKTYQSYEISRESLLSEMGYLQQTLEEVQRRTGVQLMQLQTNVNALEAELQQLSVSTETQRSEYTALLDLKMRLELEIEEYRRLLGGELEKKVVTVTRVEEKMTEKVIEKLAIKVEEKVEEKMEEEVTEKVEERKPHIERRTRTIVEEIVDGVVVNHKVDEQIEDIQ